MEYRELIDSLKYIGKDPSRLIFEDELTGIHNRRFLLGYLDNKIRWDTAEDFPVSLLGLDIDHFKQINDTYGHDAGDQTLVWLASLLKEVSGDRAMPVRYSGDEFMVLLPGTDEKAARDVAQRILHQTKLKAFRIKDGRGDVSITVSIGIATAPDSAGNGRELIRSADSALYYAKRAGRNQAASAGEIDLDAVFANRALQKITSPGLVGRDQALGTVSKALDTFPTGTSQLLLFEGAPGMGKTTLLETIRSRPGP